MTTTTATIAATIAPRRFGVEIECLGVSMERMAAAMRAAGLACNVAGYTHITTPYWKVVTDASLSNGCELVSPVLMGSEGLAELATACRVLNELGARVDRSCGLHVHVDARDLDLAATKRVCKSFVKHEADFDALVPRSRRDNHYAKGHVGFYGSREAAAAKIDAATSMAALTNAVCWSADRFHKLNLHSLGRHGTIEYRQHSGTIDAEKMTAWVQLVVGCTHNSATAKSVTLAGKDTFGLLIGNAPAPARRYLTARRAALVRSGE